MPPPSPSRDRGTDARRLRDAQPRAASRSRQGPARGVGPLPSACHAPGEAEAEVERRRNEADWLGYAALQHERLLGWIGALRSYAHGWEIHPLVVAPDWQRRGIGSALLERLEARARDDGVLTLFLGSDDDYGGTTLYGRDLLPDVLGHAATVEATPRGHALTFYRRHGYRIVGVLPDVNGPGRPDIFMAKRLIG